MNAQFLDDAVKDDRQIKGLTLVCECKADITWYRVPNTEWTAKDAKARIDEAVKWYDRYCIRLNFQEFSLNPNVKAEKKIQDKLDRLVKEYTARVARVPRARAAAADLLNDVQSALLSIYDQISAKAGRDRLVVIFLDEWFVKVGVTDNPNRWRTFRISANDGLRLLIGLDRYDTGSPHILTHELLHALRKVSGRPNGGCIGEFVRVNGVTIAQPVLWPGHYGGRNQDKAMSFTNRAAAFRRFSKDLEDVPTVREYLTILQGGYVRCKPGCHGKKRVERTRRVERLLDSRTAVRFPIKRRNRSDLRSS